jgi:hypothetical protein
MKLRMALLALASLGLWVGCSAKSAKPALLNGDTDSGVPPLPQGGGHPDGGGEGGLLADGGTACSGLTLDNATVVTTQEVAEAAPLPLGGTITDGTYVLTKDTVYTGPGGTTGSTGVQQQAIQRFAGSAIEVVVSQPPNPTEALSGTYATASVTNDAGTSTPTRISFLFTCPAGAPTSTFSYTATGTTLLEFVSASEVLTYTAQ